MATATPTTYGKGKLYNLNLAALLPDLKRPSKRLRR